MCKQPMPVEAIFMNEDVLERLKKRKRKRQDDALRDITPARGRIRGRN